MTATGDMIPGEYVDFITASTTGSRTNKPSCTSLRRKVSAFSKSGYCQAEPLSQNESLDASGRLRSCRPATMLAGRCGTNMPSLSWMPKNSVSGGLSAGAALVEPPRTVMKTRFRYFVTTRLYWLSAMEMKEPPDSLRLRQMVSTKGESEGRSSQVKSIPVNPSVVRYCNEGASNLREM